MQLKHVNIYVILLIIKATVSCSVLCLKRSCKKRHIIMEDKCLYKLFFTNMIFIFNSITILYIPREINSHNKRHRCIYYTYLLTVLIYICTYMYIVCVMQLKHVNIYSPLHITAVNFEIKT